MRGKKTFEDWIYSAHKSPADTDLTNWRFQGYS